MHFRVEDVDLTKLDVPLAQMCLEEAYKLLAENQELLNVVEEHMKVCKVESHWEERAMLLECLAKLEAVSEKLEAHLGILQN